MSKITPKQLTIIHIAKAQLNIDDDIYKAILQTKFNRESASELTSKQGYTLIEHFIAKGFKPKKSIKKTTNNNPTKLQIELIDVLKANIVWKHDNGFELWLCKRMNIPKVTTKNDASRVIEGLKGMLKINSDIIALKALPFPLVIDENYFINNSTGEVLPYRWVYDLDNKKLIRVEINE